MGQVYAHVGQVFTARHYDVLIIGAGRLGSLCAHFLRQEAPLSVLLLDQGGLPNEEGACALAPGIWTERDLVPQERGRAEFTRRLITGELGAEAGGLGAGGLHEAPTLTRGLLELLPAQAEGACHLSDLRLALPPGLIAENFSGPVDFDARALTYSVAGLTTRAAQSAIKAGADLMLNARAIPKPRGAVLERLTVTNTHQIVVHEMCTLSVGQLIIAAGAAGPALAEQHLGAVTHHAQVYRQFPRLNIASTDQTPLLRLGGLTLRPHAGGLTLVLPIHHRDPHGYVPTGGRLSGVPVGVRREVLQDLLAAMPTLAGLGTEALEVGRSVSDVPGAWWALPEGGWPSFEALDGHAWLVLGGPRADLTAAAVARELAQAVAKRARAAQ